MTAEQARDLEDRLRARGLSRKARREALTEFRAWLAEQPAPASERQDEVLAETHIEAVEAAARALLRDLRRR